MKTMSSPAAPAYGPAASHTLAGARELRAVAYVVAVIAACIAGSAVFFSTWDARSVCFYVGAAMLVISLGIGWYTIRPAAFGDAEVIADPLRTSYHDPARVPAPPRAAVSRDEIPSNAHRSFGVSEHVYAWQQVRRVPEGERIWTREYVRLVAGQALVSLAAMVATIAVTIAVTLGLGAAPGALWFLAGGLVLAVFFYFSLPGFIAAGEEHPSEPMPALPDFKWSPVSARAGEQAPALAEAEPAAEPARAA